MQSYDTVLADMVAAGTATGMIASSTIWDGCIEERLTGNADINGPATSDLKKVVVKEENPVT